MYLIIITIVAIVLAIPTVVIAVTTLCAYVLMAPNSAAYKDHAKELAAIPGWVFRLQTWLLSVAHAFLNLAPAPLRVAEVSVAFMSSQVGLCRCIFPEGSHCSTRHYILCSCIMHVLLLTYVKVCECPAMAPAGTANSVAAVTLHVQGSLCTTQPTVVHIVGQHRPGGGARALHSNVSPCTASIKAWQPMIAPHPGPMEQPDVSIAHLMAHVIPLHPCTLRLSFLPGPSNAPSTTMTTVP